MTGQEKFKTMNWEQISPEYLERCRKVISNIYKENEKFLFEHEYFEGDWLIMYGQDDIIELIVHMLIDSTFLEKLENGYNWKDEFNFIDEVRGVLE